MLTYDLNCKNKYYALYKFIRGDILSGKLKAGERLPSKRGLAQNLGVSVTCVQTAYEQLLAEGYIISVERSGYFVGDVSFDYYGEKPCRTAEQPKEKEWCELDLVSGAIPANLFPFSAWAKLTREVLADCGEHLLNRVPCDGDGELKKALASYLYRARGVNVDPRYIVIGAGAEHLYGVVLQLLGRDKIYAVENPGYGNISYTYRLYGAECVYLPVNADGVNLKAVESSGAFAVHISPSHQFPTGAVTPAFARAKLINWAKSGDKFIIEDDYDSEFRLLGKPLQCLFGLCRDRVIYINTFSKSLAPSMRMGYAVLPPKLYEKYIEIYGRSANVVPLFEQKTLAKMLDSGFFERHINRLRNHFREIRRALVEKLKSFDICKDIIDTCSGPHLLMRFSGDISDKQFKLIAAERGIYVKCLSDYLLEPFDNSSGYAVINYTSLTKSAVENFLFK